MHVNSPAVNSIKHAGEVLEDVTYYSVYKGMIQERVMFWGTD